MPEELDQVPVYWRREALEKVHGEMPPDEVFEKRIKNCHLIVLICRAMNFPYYTACTAQHLFHRFYAFYSFQLFEPDNVIVACVLLASKMEETIRKSRDIIMAAYAILDEAASAETKVYFSNFLFVEFQIEGGILNITTGN